MKRVPAWAKGMFHGLICAIAALAAQAVQAEAVTTYGAGLKSCKAYLDARGGTAPEQARFIDWLSGYFSGVNKTSAHRNNFLGLADLGAALNSLDTYCDSRPRAAFAEAAAALIFGAKVGPSSHTLDGATSYGAADKSCQVYRDARAQREVEYWTEFTDWMGGYLSGVNAISLRTANILGDAQLTDAVRWLDDYCDAHSPTSFGAAVEALVVANSPGPTASGLAQSKSAQSGAQSAGLRASRSD
jgi:hypothetical protein